MDELKFLNKLRNFTLAETRELMRLIEREWVEQNSGNAGTQDKADKATHAFVASVFTRINK